MRFLWAALFVTGVAISCFLIIQSWRKFQESPVVVTIERNYNEWKIPLPANIICPVKVLRRKLKQVIADVFGEVGKAKQNYYKSFMRDLSSLNGTNLGKMFQYEDDVTLANLSLVEFQEKIREIPPMTVKDRNHEKTCKGEFLNNKYGSCVAYNSALNKIAKIGYELAQGEMLRNSIESSDHEQMIVASFLLKGMKMFLNSPFEYPQMMTNYYQHEGEQGRPNVRYHTLMLRAIVSSPSLRRLSIYQRKCIFRDEQKLPISHIYTRVACMVQCEYERAMEACGCSPLIFLNLGRYKSCDVKGLACIGRQKDVGMEINCGCYSGCEEENFEVTVIARFRLDIAAAAYHMTSFPSFRYKRDIMFGDVEMLVSFGGIGTLFFGGSLMSIVEIVYLSILNIFRIVSRKCKIRSTSSKPKRISRSDAFSTRLERIGILGSSRHLTPHMKRRRNKHGFVNICEGKTTVVIAYKAFCSSIKEYMTVSSVCGIKYIKEAPNNAVRFLWFCIWTAFAAFAIIVSIELKDKYVHGATTYVMQTDHSPMNASLISMSVCFIDEDRPQMSCPEVLFNCSVNGKPFDCCSYMDEGISEVETCFTLNSLQSSKALMLENTITHEQPSQIRLSLLYYTETMKVYYLSPYEIPTLRGFSTAYSGTLDAVFKQNNAIFRIIEEVADKDVYSIPEELRKCKFPHETQGLWVFKYYSLSACIAQCRVEAKIKLCNCTDILIGQRTDKQKLCDAKGMECIKETEDKLEPVNTFAPKSYGLNCKCPISCIRSEIMMVNVKNNGEIIQVGDSAVVTVDMLLAKTQRRMIVIRSTIDIAVSLGGVFGFFLGASLMSVVEILYFLLARPFCIYLKNRRNITD